MQESDIVFQPLSNSRSVDSIKAGSFNLDLKNPHSPDTGPGDIEHLLPEYEKLLEDIARTCDILKRELEHALTR